MTLRQVDLPPEVPGALWLSPMPGRFTPYAEFEARTRREGIALVVCLTPLDEVGHLAPDYLDAVRSGHVPYRWHHQPMVDFGLAGEHDAYLRTVRQVADHLRAGHAALLHCAAGIGRTGTTAACVLKALGSSTEDALAAVRAAGANPQSALQSGLIDRF